MRLYEERNYKREITCGYCYAEGHNKRHCPQMKAQWDANPQVHETYDHSSLVGIDKTMFPTHYQNYWDDSGAKRQFRSHWQYMKNRFAPKAETKTKKRRKPKCGFCGSTAHNRRNCNKLKNFIYVLNETNKAYRAAYYDKFIEGMGLGAGALVSVRHPFGDEHTGVGMITSFPTENIMFTNLKRSWSEYVTRAKATVMVGGENMKISITNDAFYCDKGYNYEGHGQWSQFYGAWGNIKAVVSPAPNRPSKEWFMGQAPCFDWIVKKRDQASLICEFSNIIKQFYPHNNLRAKLGAKIYDKYYTR